MDAAEKFQCDRMKAELSGLNTNSLSDMKRGFFRMKSIGYSSFVETMKKKGIVDSYRVGYFSNGTEFSKDFSTFGFYFSIAFRFEIGHGHGNISTLIDLPDGEAWKCLVSFSDLITEVAVNLIPNNRLSPNDFEDYLVSEGYNDMSKYVNYSHLSQL
jgi:hypothetical protein